MVDRACAPQPGYVALVVGFDGAHGLQRQCSDHLSSLSGLSGALIYGGYEICGGSWSRDGWGTDGHREYAKPAGQSILSPCLREGRAPGKLFAGAFISTIIMVLAFLLLPS